MLPKRLDRKTIYESQWINLHVDKILMSSGKIVEEYHQLDYPSESVVALLTNSKKEICFIKALRYTSQRIRLELPAGCIDKGEDILKAAARETIEETGFKTKNLELVYSYNPSGGISNQVMHIVFGEVEDNKQIEFDTDEVEKVKWFSMDEVKEMIRKKELSDGVSLMPLLLFLSEITK